MHRVGLGGFQNFDAALANAAGGGSPAGLHDAGVERRLQIRDDPRRSAGHGRGDRRFAGLERVGRSVGSGLAGHEEVCVERDARRRRKAVHRHARASAVESPAHFRTWGSTISLPPPGAKTIPQFYADSVVVAYRRPASDVSVESLHPKMTASGGSPDLAMLTDGDLEKTTKLADSGCWRELPGFNTNSRAADDPRHHLRDQGPGRIAAMVAGIAAPEKTLEASDDGQSFRGIVKLPGGECPEHTVSFAAVTAKYFRVTFKRTPPPPLPAGPPASIQRPSESSFRRRRPTMRSPSWCCIPERA